MTEQTSKVWSTKLNTFIGCDAIGVLDKETNEWRAITPNELLSIFPDCVLNMPIPQTSSADEVFNKYMGCWIKKDGTGGYYDEKTKSWTAMSNELIAKARFGTGPDFGLACTTANEKNTAPSNRV
jgi:alpha-mannosidase